jgi:ATPase subunit of ABC transporter with duplicated ATPase domains
MESLDLTQLTLRYFEMESEIDKMNKQKEEYQAQITQQYNLKGELWVLIKKKQKELEDEIEENKRKLKESLENAQLKRAQMKREKLEKAIEERKKRESDPDYILQKEKERAMNDLCYKAIEGDDLNWHSGKGPNIIKTQKIKERKPRRRFTTLGPNPISVYE